MGSKKVRLVSLGYGCRIAWHLRRLGLSGPTLPFDWCNSSCGLLECLEDDFRQFFDLHTSPHWSGDNCITNAYGIKFSHDILDGFEEKYKRRIDRFRELRERADAIYVREGDYNDVPASYNVVVVERRGFDGDKWQGDDKWWKVVIEQCLR